MIFVLKSPLNAEIVYYNFNFAFNYKNANQPPDIKDEFYLSDKIRLETAAHGVGLLNITDDCYPV